jgi:death-associated protein kinase
VQSVKEETIRELVALGGDALAQDTSGHTPLHHAARAGQEETVKLLLELGANVHAQDAHGTTPLQCAIRDGSHGNSKVVGGVRW